MVLVLSTRDNYRNVSRKWCYNTVVFGDCGDSLFHDFRGWASVQRKKLVRHLLENPDEASNDLTKYTLVTDFRVGQLPQKVAGERFGSEYRLSVVKEFPKELCGDWVADENLENAFPKAWSLFHEVTTINPSQELPWPYDTNSH